MRLIYILSSIYQTQSIILELVSISLSISPFQFRYNCTNITLTKSFECIMSINKMQTSNNGDPDFQVDLKVLKQDYGCLIFYNGSAYIASVQAQLIVLELNRSSFEVVHFQIDGNIQNNTSYQYISANQYEECFFFACGWSMNIYKEFTTQTSISNQSNSKVTLTIQQAKQNTNLQYLQGILILYNGSDFNVTQISYSGVNSYSSAISNVGVSVQATFSINQIIAIFSGFNSYYIKCQKYSLDNYGGENYFGPKIYPTFCNSTSIAYYCAQSNLQDAKLLFNSYNSSSGINYTQLFIQQNTTNLSDNGSTQAPIVSSNSTSNSPSTTQNSTTNNQSPNSINTLNSSTGTQNSTSNNQSTNSNSTSQKIEQNDTAITHQRKVSQNSIQSTLFQTQGCVTLQLIITLSNDQTQQQIQSYADQIQSDIIPADVQSRAMTNYSIQDNQITYNVTISGSVTFASITIKDRQSQLLQQSIYMTPGYPSNSQTTSQQSAISDAILQNTTILSQIINNLKYTAILTFLANNPQFIGHYLLIQVQVPVHVWESQRVISIFTWKIIPCFKDRFNQGTIQNYNLFGVDIDKEVELNQSDYSPFHVLMISNYFLVNLQIQVVILVLVILLTIYMQIYKKKKQVEQDLDLKYLTHKLSEKVSLQLICKVLEAFTIQILCSSLFQMIQTPFKNKITVLSICSFIIGILFFLFYLLVNVHQFLVSFKVRKHINILIRSQKQLTQEEIQYYRSKYSFDLCDNHLNRSALTFHFHYLMIIKKLLFAFTTILLYGKPLIQLIILATVQISSLLLTIILRPYNQYYQQSLHVASNVLLSVALIYRIMLQKTVDYIKEGQHNDESIFAIWDQQGWIVVYCEISAVLIECLITVILVGCLINKKITEKSTKDKSSSEALIIEQNADKGEQQKQCEVLDDNQIFQQSMVHNSQIENIYNIYHSDIKEEDEYTSEQLDKMILDMYNKVKQGMQEDL